MNTTTSIFSKSRFIKNTETRKLRKFWEVDWNHSLRSCYLVILLCGMEFRCNRSCGAIPTTMNVLYSICVFTHMASHGNPWRPMGSHGTSWAPMELPMGREGTPCDGCPMGKRAQPLRKGSYFIGQDFSQRHSWRALFLHSFVGNKTGNLKFVETHRNRGSMFYYVSCE